MKKERNSGIEILKIVAIFMIVVSHVIQTLESFPQQIESYPLKAFIDLSNSTTSIKIIILQNLRFLGSLGNAIFFICSAWFLCDSKSISVRKIIQILFDVWVISTLCLFIFKLGGVNVSVKIMIKSFLPTLFSNNWYITFYVLMYAIHPLLNIIINQLSQKSHLVFCMISFFLYFVICFVKGGSFFQSELITYTVLYFCIAYIKKYAHKFSSNIVLNYKILFTMTTANLGIVLLSDFLGLFGERFYESLGKQVLRWCSNCNPFLVLIALSLFNICREKRFYSKFVNYIASLSLLIYVIHENIIFKTYIRPRIFIYIYKTYSYDLLLVWVLIFSITLFVVSMIWALIYQNSFHRFTSGISETLAARLKTIINKLADKFLSQKQENNKPCS